MDYTEKQQYINRCNKELQINHYLNKIVPELINYFKQGNFRILKNNKLSKKDKSNIEKITGDYKYLQKIGFHYFYIVVSGYNIYLKYSYHWKVSEFSVSYNDNIIYLYDCYNNDTYEYKPIKTITVEEKCKLIAEYKALEKEVSELNRKMSNIKLKLAMDYI